jgi:uncharacterized protein
MDLTKKNILITGASGLIGTRLTELLIQKGHQVSHLGRRAKSGKTPSFVWDVDKQSIDLQAFAKIDTIIHLAGAGIADKRWTDTRKKEIIESRTHSTQLLSNSLQRNPHNIKNFISASAIGYYGFSLDDSVFTEDSKPGNDFLARVTYAWESEVDKIAELGLRVCKLRIGIVLSEKGGALKSMMIPIKWFVGSPLASGKQHVSWIHLDDLCAMFIHLAENNQLSGAFNGTGLYSVTNTVLTKQIAQQLRRPLFLPRVPAFVLKLILGEMADMVVQGNSVSSKKIQNTDFTFQFASLEETLKNLLIK